MEGLTRELNVSYSSFRQAFEAQTKQYKLQIRVQKHKDFLATTPKSVGDHAYRVPFLS